MKKIFCIKTGIFLLLLFSAAVPGLRAMSRAEIDKLLEKMERATDPEKVAVNIKTQRQKAEISIPMQKIKITAVITDKFPDKTKTLTVLPGIMSTLQIYNGKQAWEYSQAAGIREIKGKELNSMKFEMDLKNPKLAMRDVFAEIAVDDTTVKLGNSECYKLTCTPKKEYGLKPLIYYVNVKDFLIRQMEAVMPTKMGDIKTVSVFSDFRKTDKLIVPMHITVRQLNMTMEVRVLKVENNIKLDDSEFDKPSPDSAGQ